MSLNPARRRRAPALGLGIALGLTLAATVAGPVSAANNVVVFAYFGDCQFAGSNAGASKTVKIEWRDNDGRLKSKHSVISTSAGKFTTKCELDELLEKGDVLKTTIGTAVRSFTVPKLTLRADRYSDSVGGKTQPSVDLVITVLTTGPHSLNPGLATTRTYTTASDNSGNYGRDAGNLIGWDDVFVDLTNSRGDTFSRHVTANGMRVWIDQPFLQMVGNPGVAFDLRLSRGGGDLSYTTHSLPASGGLAFSFTDEDGDPVRVKPNDSVGSNISYDATFVVPNITAVLSKATNKVTGNCGVPGVFGEFGVAVFAHSRDYARSAVKYGITDLTQAFTVNFKIGTSFVLKTGDKVDVYCKLSFGDVAARTFTVP